MALVVNIAMEYPCGWDCSLIRTSNGMKDYAFVSCDGLCGMYVCLCVYSYINSHCMVRVLGEELFVPGK